MKDQVLSIVDLDGAEDYLDEFETDNNSGSYQCVPYDGPDIDPEELF